jgi:hypothetical protein
VDSLSLLERWEIDVGQRLECLPVGHVLEDAWIHHVDSDEQARGDLAT